MLRPHLTLMAFLAALAYGLLAPSDVRSEITPVYYTIKSVNTGQYLTSLDKPLGCCITGNAVAMKDFAGPSMYQVFEIENVCDNEHLLIKSVYKQAYLESASPPLTTYFKSGENSVVRNYHFYPSDGCIGNGSVTPLFYEDSHEGDVSLLGTDDEYEFTWVEGHALWIDIGTSSDSGTTCELITSICSGELMYASTNDGAQSGKTLAAFPMILGAGNPDCPGETGLIEIGLKDQSCTDSVEITEVRWDNPNTGSQTTFAVSDGTGGDSFWLRSEAADPDAAGEGYSTSRVLWRNGNTDYSAGSKPAKFIKSTYSPNHCIVIEGAVENGTTVELGSCDDSSWYYDSSTKMIRLASNSNYCLHKTSVGWDNGNVIHLWSCDKGSNENKQWVLDGGYIKGAGNSSKCFAHEGSYTSWTDGDAIHIWDCVSDPNRNNELWDVNYIQ